MKEIKSLTCLRGVAAFYIVIGHIFENYWKTVDINLWNHDTFLKGILFNLVNHISLSVDVFFIMSAFVLALANQKYFGNGVARKDYKDYFVKRFARIYPIYILSISVFFILFRKDFDRFDYFINVLLFQTFFPKITVINPVSWSLSTEWVVYLIFPFLLFFLFWKKQLASYIYMVLGILLYVTSYYLPFNQRYLDLEKCIGCYLLGLYAYRLFLTKSKVVTFCNKYVQFISLTVIALLLIKNTNVCFGLLLSMFVLAILDNNAVSNWLSSKPIYFLGLISYSLYLNHWIIYRIAAGVCEKMAFPIWCNRIIFFINVPLAIVVSYLTYKFIEIPAGHFIRKKFFKDSN